MVALNLSFKRTSGFQVAPSSRKEITQKAWNARCKLGWDNIYNVPLLQLEKQMIAVNPAFYLGAMSVEEMEDREGITIPSEHAIYLRDDVFESLDLDKPRARFTLAHEIGHFVLHPDQTTGFARTSRKSWPIYCDSEWQANAFAADFLMPPLLIKTLTLPITPSQVALIFGVSEEAASNQIFK